MGAFLTLDRLNPSSDHVDLSTMATNDWVMAFCIFMIAFHMILQMREDIRNGR